MNAKGRLPCAVCGENNKTGRDTQQPLPPPPPSTPPPLLLNPKTRSYCKAFIVVVTPAAASLTYSRP